MLCFHCCIQVFSSCGKWGLLFIVVCGLLTAVASLAEPQLWDTKAAVVEVPGL